MSVRLALVVVMHNDGNFVDVILHTFLLVVKANEIASCVVSRLPERV